MATLDDKLLGEKLEYYCSSDEGEEEGSDNEENHGEAAPQEEPLAPPPLKADGTSNTGPKGVIKDWQRYKQLEIEKREEQEKERLELAKKLCLTCEPSLDEEEDPELAEFLTDQFLIEYSRQRMQELWSQSAPKSLFGSVLHLRSGDEYLDAIDKEDKAVTVVLHVMEDKVVSCRTMNACLDELAPLHPRIKFCKMSASTAGLSRGFKSGGVPALLVYKAGQLIGNFIQLGEVFGPEFTANDVENYLIENGVTIDAAEFTKTIR